MALVTDLGSILVYPVYDTSKKEDGGRKYIILHWKARVGSLYKRPGRAIESNENPFDGIGNSGWTISVDFDTPEEAWEAALYEVGNGVQFVGILQEEDIEEVSEEPEEPEKEVEVAPCWLRSLLGLNKEEKE